MARDRCGASVAVDQLVLVCSFGPVLIQCAHYASSLIDGWLSYTLHEL